MERQQDQDQDEATTSGRALRLALLGAIVLAGVLALAVLPTERYLLAFFRWARSVGGWGLVALACVYVLGSAVLIPGSVMGLGAGFLGRAAFGWGWGLLAGMTAAWVGGNVGAALAFLVTRFVARGWVERRLAGHLRLSALDRAVADEGFRVVLLMRLSPVVPHNIANAAMGVTRVPLRTYVLATALGAVPGTLAWVYLGAGLGELTAQSFHRLPDGRLGEGLFWGGLVMAVAVAALLARLAGRALKREIQAHQSPP